MTNILYAVRIETNLDFGSIVEAGLELLNEEMIVVRHVDDDVAHLEAYYQDRTAAEEQEQRLRVHLKEWSQKDIWEIHVKCLPDCDWQEQWKSFFHVERITPRLVIKPSWESHVAERDECVIEMDPGLSFGTGSHFTTKSCLECIDNFCEAVTTRALLDLGCGSGILAIAAARLGYLPVVAIDADAVAVTRTRENAEINGVDKAIECRHVSIFDYRSARRFDVVAANLFAEVLIATVQQIEGLLMEDSEARLILSGILNEQYSRVAPVFGAAGFDEAQVLSDHEWTTMVLRRRV